MISQTLLHILQ